MEDEIRTQTVSVQEVLQHDTRVQWRCRHNYVFAERHFEFAETLRALAEWHFEFADTLRALAERHFEFAETPRALAERHFDFAETPRALATDASPRAGRRRSGPCRIGLGAGARDLSVVKI